VNSPFLERNSLVPSSGSTSQNGPSPTSGSSPRATASSATIGTSGVSSRSAARMAASPASSAVVTGEESAFVETAVAPPA
jgi:hypothetical protein